MKSTPFPVIYHFCNGDALTYEMSMCWQDRRTSESAYLQYTLNFLLLYSDTTDERMYIRTSKRRCEYVVLQPYFD